MDIYGNSVKQAQNCIWKLLYYTNFCINWKKLVKTYVILEKLWSFRKGFVWRAFVIMLGYIVLGDI